MTKAEQPTITQSDHEVIYLAPKCFGVERSWCEDAGVEDCDCIDGPHDWIKFHRTTSLAAQDGLVDALTELRGAGWMVAVHNDYRLCGNNYTFWLFTHPDGRWIKGEAESDVDAVKAALSAIKGDKS